MSIADRLKEFREARSMSQLDVALQAKVSPTLICKIEMGQRIPSVAIAHEISKVLNFRLDDLFDDKKGSESNDPT